MRAKVAFFCSGVLCAKGRWCIKLGFKTLNSTLFFFFPFFLLFFFFLGTIAHVV